MLKQQAIIVTKDNVNKIAETLIDYSAQDILDEALLPLNQGKTVILVRYDLDGVHTVSHIVLKSMFYANATTVQKLTDTYFADVVQR